MKKGAPGACPISSLWAEMINSGQSHRLAVGSAVAQYNMALRQKTAKAIRELMFLKYGSFMTLTFCSGCKNTASRMQVMNKKTYICLTFPCQQAFVPVSSTRRYLRPLQLTIRREDCAASADFIRLMNVYRLSSGLSFLCLNAAQISSLDRVCEGF